MEDRTSWPKTTPRHAKLKLGGGRNAETQLCLESSDVGFMVG